MLGVVKAMEREQAPMRCVSLPHRRLRAPSEHSARLSSLGAQNGHLSVQPPSAHGKHDARHRARRYTGDGLHTIDEDNVVALGVGFKENASGGPPDGKDNSALAAAGTGPPPNHQQTDSLRFGPAG